MTTERQEKYSRLVPMLEQENMKLKYGVEVLQRHIQQQDAELKRLRKEIVQKDAEIKGLYEAEIAKRLPEVKGD